MRTLLILVLTLSLFGTCAAARADRRDVLHFDNPLVRDSAIRCDLADQASPRKGDFKLLDYVLMSSEDGQRVAIVTIRNSAGGQRIFTDQHVVALLANCQTIHPVPFERTLDVGEEVSIQLSFGYRHYPVMKVLVSQE